MANNIVLIDTSILIDYYRKTDKTNSAWIRLIDTGYHFSVSVVTKYELLSGATPAQNNFWSNVFSILTVLPLTENCIDTAVHINSSLKRKRKQIDIADLFIAATSVTHNLPFATLNKKHFERIDELTIIS